MEILWLKYLGLPHQTIARIAQVAPNTVTRCIKIYNQEGLQGIKQLHYTKPQGALLSHRESLEEHLREHPPLTAAQAQEQIRALTGITRSGSQVRAFMHRIGMKPRKIAQLPGKAVPEKQQDFLEQTLTPLLEEAQAGRCHLFFVDAAHFVLGFFLTTIWSFARVWLPTPSGRNRFNVLGALHAVSLELVRVTNDSYINAQTVGQLLRLLANQYSDVPIYLVMDNARYQHCRYVEALAKELGIVLVFLPAYSPNLNLIERLWKFVRKKVLYGKYYQKSAQFQAAIEGCLDKVNHDAHYKAELKSLLTLQFQTFPNSQNLPV